MNSGSHDWETDTLPLDHQGREIIQRNQDTLVSYTLIFSRKSLFPGVLVVECPSSNHQDQGSNPGEGHPKVQPKKFYRLGFYSIIILNALGVYFDVWMVTLIVDLTHYG